MCYIKCFRKYVSQLQYKKKLLFQLRASRSDVAWLYWIRYEGTLRSFEIECKLLNKVKFISGFSYTDVEQ